MVQLQNDNGNEADIYKQNEKMNQIIESQGRSKAAKYVEIIRES